MPPTLREIAEELAIDDMAPVVDCPNCDYTVAAPTTMGINTSLGIGACPNCGTGFAALPPAERPKTRKRKRGEVVNG